MLTRSSKKTVKMIKDAIGWPVFHFTSSDNILSLYFTDKCFSMGGSDISEQHLWFPEDES